MKKPKGPPLVHMVAEDDGDVSMCGTPAISLASGDIVDRAGKPFYFVWSPDDERQSTCEMCRREFNKRNPPVLQVVR